MYEFRHWEHSACPAHHKPTTAPRWHVRVTDTKRPAPAFCRWRVD